eukprot:7390014-Prymnesium_polylepis.1
MTVDARRHVGHGLHAKHDPRCTRTNVLRCAPSAPRAPKCHSVAHTSLPHTHILGWAHTYKPRDGQGAAASDGAPARDM